MTDKAVLNRLLQSIDLLASGPKAEHVDDWIREVIVGLGIHFRLALVALHYETGRIAAGVERPGGLFMPDDYASRPLSLWIGSELNVPASTSFGWIEQGLEQTIGSPSNELKRRALLTLLQPIGVITEHPWLIELSNALQALNHGEVADLLTKPATGSRPQGGAYTAWSIVLSALRWIEIQRALKLRTRSEAQEFVAGEFNVAKETVEGWKATTERHFGKGHVRQTLEQGEVIGLLWEVCKDFKPTRLDDDYLVTPENRNSYVREIFDRQLRDMAKTHAEWVRKMAVKSKKKNTNKSS